MHVEETEQQRLQPHNVVDCVVFGRRLRALRIMEGFDRAGDFTSVLRPQFGVDVSDRTLYAIERGEQMPHFDFFVAAVTVLHVGLSYFFPALRADVVDRIRVAHGQGADS